ncbi:MAG: bifunctional oligoribonuclease/PAP phosphatase NrnA [Phycisphaerae bacterium]
MPNPVKLNAAGVIARLDRAARIVLTTHARADGDAIGSTVALRRILQHRGKTVRAFLHEPTGEPYAFLTANESCEIWSTASAADVLEGSDLLVILDTCAKSQLGDIAEVIEAATVPKLAIDHHRTRDAIVDEVFVDERAAACAGMISALCERSKWSVDPSAAEMLYVGLATDTGWFRFSNADLIAYATASRLIAAGARPNELYERLYLNESASRARLRGAVLSSFELHADGRLAVVRITRSMLASCGATRAMTENLVNEPQCIGSVLAAVLLVEPDDDGPVRVSFRSKRAIDVAAIAAHFGGGGHTRAAGARIAGRLDAVAERVIAKMTEAIATLDREER